MKNSDVQFILWEESSLFIKLRCIVSYLKVFGAYAWEEHQVTCQTLLAVWRAFKRIELYGILAKDHHVIVGMAFAHRVSINHLRHITQSDYFDFLFRNLDTSVYYATRLGVRKDLQHNQIGRRLFEKLLENLSSGGVTHVTAVVDAQNIASVRIMERFSFSKVQQDVRFPSSYGWYRSLKGTHSYTP